MKSIIQNEKYCYICGSTCNLHEHHIFFGTANRQLSEKYGLKVFLCVTHHTGSRNAVHMNRDADLYLKRIAQSEFESVHGTRDDFISIFGKSYL